MARAVTSRRWMRIHLRLCALSSMGGAVRTNNCRCIARCASPAAWLIPAIWRMVLTVVVVTMLAIAS